VIKQLAHQIKKYGKSLFTVLIYQGLTPRVPATNIIGKRSEPEVSTAAIEVSFIALDQTKKMNPK
jgi:hypothetical protein